MKFVFFDIECAGVHKNYAKICVFGYVVCDENFNIIKKEDILINPKGRFELTDRKGEKGIVLPYEYDDFKKQPTFPRLYGQIKKLLEDKDSIVLGHAVLNDVKYLNLETRRFKLPSFEFTFNDSQLLFMTYVNDFSRQFGLEHIANELGVEFVPHRAADDAYATMRIVEAMCREKSCTYAELIKQYNITDGKIEKYNITRPQSEAFIKYSEERQAFKEARAKARTEFYNNLSGKRFKKGGKLGGATFTFSRALEDDTKVSVPLVNRLYELGGKYSGKADLCRYYVCTEGDDSFRTKNARNSRVEIILLEDLKKMLYD